MNKHRSSRQVLTSIRWALAAVALFYTTIFLTWRLLLATPVYERVWQLQLSEVFASWVYLPVLALAVVALLAGSRVALLVLAVPAIFFAVEYGGQFLPHRHALAAADDAQFELRVMTWNMLYNRDRSGEFSATVEALAPDVIALQEVGWGMGEKLREELGAAYPHQVVYRPGADSSLALLSSFPILEADVDTEWDSCHCLHALLDFHGQPITVINTHMAGPYLQLGARRGLPLVRDFETGYQNQTFDALEARLQEVDTPLLLMGDFNTTESQPNFRRLDRVLHNAFSVAGRGMGYTYPARRGYPTHTILGRLFHSPFIRIDHIFFDDPWYARRAWTGELPESDHRFVMADLALLERLPGD